MKAVAESEKPNITVHWIFDQRHITLMRSLKEYLERRHRETFHFITYYNLFSETFCESDGGPPNLIQHPPEDVNRAFMAAWDDRSAGVGTGCKDWVLGFSGEYLASNPRLEVIGPEGDIPFRLNDKGFQFPWFGAAGIPTPDFVGPMHLDHVKEALPSALAAWGRAFIQPTRSAGGELAAVLSAPSDLAAYRRRVATLPGIEGQHFLLTAFLPNAHSLSAHGLVTRAGSVHALAVVDLLQDGFKFDGFVFPSVLPQDDQTQALLITETVGHMLAAQGYWGWYTVDFVNTPTLGLRVTEANVRFAGEAGFIAGLSGCNMFDTLLDDAPWCPGPRLAAPEGRMVVTKIRPPVGAILDPEPPRGSVEDFMDGTHQEFRISYLSGPVRVESAHFVGLAGRWFADPSTPDLALSYYQIARRPIDAWTSGELRSNWNR